MDKEINFQTYLSISSDKFGIYLFEKKNLKNLYKEEVLLDNKNNIIDFNALFKFLEDNIYKIENAQQELLKDINLKIQHETMLKVKNIIQTAIVDLDTLYIAIDGTPSIAKMVEQKKRRFMGKLYEYIERELIEKYKKDLENQNTKFKYNNRYIFEKYKIRWTTSHISPGTKFMINFGNNLKSSTFINKYILPKNYIFSNFTSVGEGEKKIINYIMFMVL